MATSSLRGHGLRGPSSTLSIATPSASLTQTSRSVSLPLQQGPTLRNGTNSQSAISPASMTSSPCVGSPLQSPVAADTTTDTSIQPSPDFADVIRGRGMHELPSMPSLDQLPDPLLSHKTSASSLGQQSHYLPSNDGSQSKTTPGVFRRLSNRVKSGGKNLRPGRRQSSAHARSRDASLGPHMVRRGRSSSSVTAASEVNLLACASEPEEDLLEPSTPQLAYYETGQLRDVFSPTRSGPPSVNGSSVVSDVQAGPVIPIVFRKGTPATKISKKSRKRVTLVLNPEAGKIYWHKTRSSKWIYLDDIREIRVSPDVAQYRIDCGVPESEEPRFFSVIQAVADKKDKVIHFLADNDASFNEWTRVLDALSKHRQELMSSLMSFSDRAIQSYWYKEMNRIFGEGLLKQDALQNGVLDFSSVERVCRSLHIHMSSDRLRSKFDAADSKSNGQLDFTAFRNFVRLLARREDVCGIFRAATRTQELGMTFEEFCSFLRDVQGESISETESWRAAFTDLATRLPVHATTEVVDVAQDEIRMSEAAFASYLTSIHNPALSAAPVTYSLDRPLNEYHISSSHNTYLLGRQVAGISSVEGYISALLRGCRCVEIDCWDGQDGQPIVVHGRTMTSHIMFREVISTINKYAFDKSPFPLWISLEVHCNAVQQAAMTRIMIETFGEKLLREPLEGFTDRFPSPSALLGRILIKVKKPVLEESRPTEIVTAGRRRGNSTASSLYRGPSADGGRFVTSPGSSNTSFPDLYDSFSRRPSMVTEISTQELFSSASSEGSGDERAPVAPQQSRIIKILGDLGVYCMGLKFRGFEDLDCKAFNHVLSFTERTFKKHAVKPRKGQLFRHNMRYLMRVYPNQLRITSSNFDPLPYWKSGVQMAALNWQTFDLGMQLNQAMFAGGTDTSGYVLKPEEFREIKMLPNVSPEELGKRERKNLNFTIDVISAQQLMRPTNLGERRNVDPYIEVEVFLADDKRDKVEAGNGQSQNQAKLIKYRTQVIKGNGFNPIFDKKFVFNVKTKYPDLAFVKWSVKLSEGGNYSDRSNPLATYTAKVNSLKQGYHTLPLLDYNGDQYLFSTLFCKIKVDPVTSVYVDQLDSETARRSRKLGLFGRNPSNTKQAPADGQ